MLGSFGGSLGVVSFVKLELPYFRVDGRTKYSLASFVFLLDILALKTERVAFDMVNNRFVNMTGTVRGNHGQDHYVEFSVRALRNRLVAAGGNLSEAQITQIVRLHEPLSTIVANVRASLNLPDELGKHDRPNDIGRVQRLLTSLRSVDMFGFQPGRKFSGHPIMPRTLLTWLDTATYTSWRENLIFEAGCKQETGVVVQPAVTFMTLNDHQLRNFEAQQWNLVHDDISTHSYACLTEIEYIPIIHTFYSNRVRIGTCDGQHKRNCRSLTAPN